MLISYSRWGLFMVEGYAFQSFRDAWRMDDWEIRYLPRI